VLLEGAPIIVPFFAIKHWIAAFAGMTIIDLFALSQFPVYQHEI
jgi:hypothetical protein